MTIVDNIKVNFGINKCFILLIKLGKYSEV